MSNIVVAYSDNNVIGSHKDLPWYLPADLKHFKQVTLGHTVVMGRKTFESIFNRLHGPLPQRTNIIVSRSMKTPPEGFLLFSSLEELQNKYEKSWSDIYFIGGGEIFREVLSKDWVDSIFLTRVHSNIEGDVYFPRIDESEWVEIDKETHSSDNKNPYDYDFIKLQRKTR